LNKTEINDAATKRQDDGVSEAWSFIDQQWALTKPKMIISVTGGKRQFFMNQRLLRSFKRGLMKAAIDTGE